MHSFDIDIVREDLKDAPDLVRTILEQARTNPLRLNMLRIQAHLWACRLSAGQPESPDLRTALTIMGRAAAANLLLAAHPNETMTISLGEGAPATFTGTGPDSTTNVASWLDAFRAASICRDRDAIQWLLETPAGVLRESSTQGDEYAYAYVDALRGFWRSDPRTPDLLIGALEGTDPERLVNADVDYVIDLVVPEMEIFLRILSRDGNAVNEALAKALRIHEGFWGKESLADDPEGFLSLGPLAMAAIAHDRGLPIEIESGYMPSWLVRGSWARG